MFYILLNSQSHMETGPSFTVLARIGARKINLNPPVISLLMHPFKTDLPHCYFFILSVVLSLYLSPLFLVDASQIATMLGKS